MYVCHKMLSDVFQLSTCFVLFHEIMKINQSRQTVRLIYDFQVGSDKVLEATGNFLLVSVNGNKREILHSTRQKYVIKS